MSIYHSESEEKILKNHFLNVMKYKLYRSFVFFLVLLFFLPMNAHAAISVKKFQSAKPQVKVMDANNSNATISWTKVSGADGYIIYRKVDGHAYRQIAKVSASVRSYKDVFFNTVKSVDKKYINSKSNANTANTVIFRNLFFVDPSYQPFIYTVRAYRTVKGKKVYSSYYKTGATKLTTATITKVTKTSNKAKISWGRVSGADAYYIYQASATDKKWTLLVKVKQVQSTVLSKTISKTVTCKNSATKFAVKAVRKENGKLLQASTYGTFNIKDQKYSNKKILFVGDSITYGVPYRGVDQTIYSYPYRFMQRTSAQVYNQSFPGGILASRKGYPSIYDGILKPISQGQNINVPSDLASKYVFTKTNGLKLKDFDVIVLNPGTNDYGYNTPLGDADSTSLNDFYGALRSMFTLIQKASQERVKEGKAPIKVVYLNLFYRDCFVECDKAYSYCGEIKNKLGYYLADYQKAINQVCKEYKDEKLLPIYQMSTSAYVNGNSRLNGITITIPGTKRKISTDNCHYTTTDNIHPTKETYAKIGDGLTDFMVKNGILK